MTIHERVPDERATPQDATSMLRWRVDRGVLAVAGEVDAMTVGAFSTALAVCNDDTTIAALDLSAVTFFSAAGVRCFISHGWTSRAHPMIIASPMVLRVLAACDIDFLLERHGWTGGTVGMKRVAGRADVGPAAAHEGIHRSPSVSD